MQLSSSGINSVHRPADLFVRTLRLFVPQTDARSFAYFALKYRRCTVVFARRPPNRAIPRIFSPTVHRGNERTFIRTKKYRGNTLGRSAAPSSFCPVTICSSIIFKSPPYLPTLRERDRCSIFCARHRNSCSI